MQRLLGPGVDPHPQVGELVGGDELPDLAVDQAVDGRRQRPDQLLQARPVGDHPGEDVVEDGLDVDLLLDRIGDPGGDDVLHLGRGDERIHRGDVALGVVQRALAPVRHGRRHGQETGQHDADHDGDRATTRRSFRCCHRFDRAAGGTRWRELRHGVSVRLVLASGAPALGPVWPLTSPGASHEGTKSRRRPRDHVRRSPSGHLWATVPRGPLTPPLPFGLFIFIELSEWIFLNG